MEPVKGKNTNGQLWHNRWRTLRYLQLKPIQHRSVQEGAPSRLSPSLGTQYKSALHSPSVGKHDCWRWVLSRWVWSGQTLMARSLFLPGTNTISAICVSSVRQSVMTGENGEEHRIHVYISWSRITKTSSLWTQSYFSIFFLVILLRPRSKVSQSEWYCPGACCRVYVLFVAIET